MRILGAISYFYFFYEDILHTKNHKKQTSDFHSDIFMRQNVLKSKQATFINKEQQNAN